jgi:hypothetical protein
MLSYGGVSLHYLFQINFAPTVFALFGLVYCGVTIVLTAVTGLWVASTAHKDVVFYYYMILLPMLTVLLLAASGVSLSGIAGADKDVNDIFDLLLLPSSGKGSTALDVLVSDTPYNTLPYPTLPYPTLTCLIRSYLLFNLLTVASICEL